MANKFRGATFAPGYSGMARAIQATAEEAAKRRAQVEAAARQFHGDNVAAMEERRKAKLARRAARNKK